MVCPLQGSSMSGERRVFVGVEGSTENWSVEVLSHFPPFGDSNARKKMIRVHLHINKNLDPEKCVHRWNWEG